MRVYGTDYWGARMTSGGNEISIQLAAHVMAVHTS